MTDSFNDITQPYLSTIKESNIDLTRIPFGNPDVPFINTIILEYTNDTIPSINNCIYVRRNIKNCDCFNIFESLGFPEYKNICYNAMEYILNEKLFQKYNDRANTDFCIQKDKSLRNDPLACFLNKILFQKDRIDIQIVVKNGSKLAKNHSEPMQYVPLIVIVMHIAENQNKILRVFINEKLYSEKITLVHDIFDTKIEENAENQISIQGQLEKAKQDMGVHNLEKLDTQSFIKLALESLKIHGGNTTSYYDLIFDMNSNASQLYANISRFYSKKGTKGVFKYTFDSPIEFILYASAMELNSRVQWVPESEFIDTPLHDLIQNEISRINSENEYVVLILIEDGAKAHTIHRDACKLPTSHRLTENNIRNSVAKCMKCRNLDNIQHIAPNKEYKWAKNKWDRLKHK